MNQLNFLFNWVVCYDNRPELSFRISCMGKGMLRRAVEFIRAVPFARRTVNTLRGRRLHRSEIKLEDRFVGSSYGGWSVDIAKLGKDSIVYSFGVGEDLSFDLELLSLVACEIYAFDPTPIAIDWVLKQSLPSALKFIPVGVAGIDGQVEFHVPPIVGWHSYSLAPERNALQTGTIYCQVKRVSTLMSELGHHYIDLLKLDVEGFEYDVLHAMIADKIRPRFLLVEFHHTIYGISRRRTLSMVRQLRDYGYLIYWVSDGGHEYGFIDAVSMRDPLSPHRQT